MRKDKEIATEMRKSGKSYREIYDSLKIPRATLSGWFGKIGWSQAIAKKLAAEMQTQHTVRIVELGKIRGQHLISAYEEARNEAREDLETLKYNPFFITGIMLYWGEGDKTTKSKVRLVNTDPEMIKLFVFFLKKVCNVPTEMVRVSIFTYPDIDDEANRKYWSEISGVASDKFIKSILMRGRHKTKQLEHGVCNVYVSSTYFKIKMLEWLKLLPKELMNLQYYENI